MGVRHEDLTWLVEAPGDFRKRCAQIDQQTSPVGTDIQRLAVTRLDTNQLTRLSSSIKKAQERPDGMAPLSQFRLGVLGNATTCLYAPALPAAAARHGVALTVEQADYDQVMQEALNPASKINSSELDAVLLALDYHSLPLGTGAAPDAAIEYVEAIRRGLENGCGAPVILQTVVCPPAPTFGSLDIRIVTTMRHQIARFNERLVAMAERCGDYILDIAAVAEMVRTQNWQDPVQWNLYKLPFAQSLVPIYVEHVARVIGAIRGTSKKCLVLDLDNTLWGGVIGDDGLDGIAIGQGDGIAEAFIDVQRTVLALRERGIVLAVSSKNDDAVARRPFRDHPEMLLREDHIAIFQANWQDKASNLEAIAKQLNIGLDALVLLDDNPVERKQVRDALPMVAVPELYPDPSLFSRTLLNAGYFEAISFSEEDKKRAESYRLNAQRAELASGSRNMDEFLASLEMTMEVHPFNPVSVARVSQLINKTNQFNLTTRRYTQPDIETMMHDDRVITIQARLLDRFGDNGIICIVIGRIESTSCEIDTWLMSCRVLGRRVEEGVLAELVRFARLGGIDRIIGRYIPSTKNDMVADHYRKLGFAPAGQEANEMLWSLSVKDYCEPQLPFRLSRSSGAARDEKPMLAAVT